MLATVEKMMLVYPPLGSNWSILQLLDANLKSSKDDMCLYI